MSCLSRARALPARRPLQVGLPVIGVVENMSGFLCPCCGTTSQIFPAAGAGPEGMAAAFGVPFLGKLPLDPLLLSACESGEAYVTKHPSARGVQPFLNITAAVVKGAEGPDAELGAGDGVVLPASSSGGGDSGSLPVA